MSQEINGTAVETVAFPASLAITEAAGAVAAGARVDGSDLTIGAKGDAAITNPANSGSLIAIMKGVLTFLGGIIGVSAASGAFAVGALADGANVVEGKTTDAPAPAGALLSTSAVTLSSAVKGIFNLLAGGNARVFSSIYWQEFNGTAIAANATSTGIARLFSGGSGTNCAMAYFQAIVFCSSAGNLNITIDGVTFQTAVAAGTRVIVKTPMSGQNFTAAFVNGGTAGTLYMQTMFTTT